MTALSVEGAFDQVTLLVGQLRERPPQTFAFLLERKRLGLELPVVILSSIARRGAEITMEALSLGASDFIMKPTGAASEDVRFVKDQLMEKLFAYGAQYRAKRGKPTSTAPLEERPAVRYLERVQDREAARAAAEEAAE